MTKRAAIKKRAAETSIAKTRYWVLADVGAEWEERQPDEASWPPAAKVAADRFLELLADESVSRKFQSLTAASAVLSVRLAGFPMEKGVVSHDAVSAALRSMLLDLTRKLKASSFAPLLGRPDSNHGQIEAAVIAVDDRETARKICRQMEEEPALKERIRHQRRTKLQSILEKPAAADFDQLLAESKELSQLSREEIADRLEPALNAKLAALRQETRAEMQAVASWVNQILREFGLAVRAADDSERPGTVVVDKGGRDGSVNRYRLDVRNSQGQHVRHTLGGTLTNLQLIPDDPRAEGGARPRSPRSR